MGIDVHNLNFLAYAQDRGVSYERTLAIGRQGVFVTPYDLERHRVTRGLAPLRRPDEPYGEPLLEDWFGAGVVDSVDASAYEQATHLHDMNRRWPAGRPELGSYDAVLDFGCLEHVFHFPVAWRNCVDLCRVGGHLLHAVPANNLAGHGFYQFSPELFTNLYRSENGFELVALFYAVMPEARYWWTVANPMAVHRRVTLRNASEVYLLVLARKLRDPGEMAAPQQSDYAQDEWVHGPPARGRSGAMRQRLLQGAAALGLVDHLRVAREVRQVSLRRPISLPGPDYRRVSVRALLGEGRTSP
jgi:SAM-dependent methyltransferase